MGGAIPDARILTVNAGSTSVRLGLFQSGAGGRQVLARQRLAASAGAELQILGSFLGPFPDQRPALIVHRVVHGGPYRTTCLFDDPVRQAVSDHSDLAPLHNPGTLGWAVACDTLLPGATALAAFDTSFYRELPEVAATYGLPRDVSERLGLRRLGFHGLAHRSMWQAFAGLNSGRAGDSGRVVSLQLGGGCSATALRDGRPMDTSMGFSPLEGLLMATRPGDLDPGIVLHMMQREQLDTTQMRDLLHRRGGLLGISGLSSDMRELLRSPAPEAALAIDVFCHRVRKYLGAYLAVLGGCDAVLVGGGAGEGSPALRQRIFDGLGSLGMHLETGANDRAAAPARISRPDSPVQVWVIPTDEESILVDEGCAWLVTGPASAGVDHRQSLPRGDHP